MKKSLLSLFILLGFAALAFLAFACKPKPEKKKSEKRLPVVMVEEVRLQELPLEIESQGSIEPLTETTAAAEVSGQVLSLADNFNAGGVFKKGDILMEIDAADYQAAYAQAQSMLADANLALQQERARGEQAARDWKKVGRGKPASDLVLRKPQLVSVQARQASAAAAADKAQRDVERTKLKAPYDGRVRKRLTDVGALVAPGTPLAEIFSEERYELRLALPIEDWNLLQAAGANQAVVELSAGKQKWQAKILRSEGVIDPNNRSVYVVAGLPPRSDGEGNSLSPGLFVKAKIEAGSIKDVALVPQRALYGEDRVLVIEKVEESSRLSFREVEVARVVGDDVLISGGLQSGEIVCVTPLAAAVDGMEVKVLTTE